MGDRHHHKMRHNELMQILEQAGPKGKEIANAISNRRSGVLELHIHINGPIVVGSKMVETMTLSLLKNNKPRE